MRAPFHSPAAQRLVTRSERVCNRELGVGAHQSSTSYFCYGLYSLDPTITTAARATSEAVAGMRSESDGSSGGLSRGVVPVHEHLDQPARDRGHEEGVAARDDVDRRDQLVRRRVLEGGSRSPPP